MPEKQWALYLGSSKPPRKKGRKEEMLERLPLELLLNILSYLPLPDILSLRLIASSFNTQIAPPHSKDYGERRTESTYLWKVLCRRDHPEILFGSGMKWFRTDSDLIPSSVPTLDSLLTAFKRDWQWVTLLSALFSRSPSFLSSHAPLSSLTSSLTFSSLALSFLILSSSCFSSAPSSLFSSLTSSSLFYHALFSLLSRSLLSCLSPLVLPTYHSR